jgi:homoserine kinase type II
VYSQPEYSGALDRAALSIRSRYPSVFAGGALIPMGNRGGFSGARIWRADSEAGALCLRAWPAQESLPHLLHIHHLMTVARQQELAFIPTVYATSAGDTVLAHESRLWDLTQWMPGRADFAEHPTPHRLQAACEALARLHRAWEVFTEAAAPCPAVRRRLDFLRDWNDFLHTGWRPVPVGTAFADPVGPVADRAARVLPRWLDELPRMLSPWMARTWPLQPCMCDLWHDHLLFDGDRLTGLVDFGAVKVDHVAVDLSRLLGSLIGDDAGGWAVGMDAYRRIRPLSEDEEKLARVLDRTGTVVGAANWLRRLYHDALGFEDLHAVAGRLESLLHRIEGWSA